LGASAPFFVSKYQFMGVYRMAKIGIIGCGFVGSAVMQANHMHDIVMVDPSHEESKTYDDLVDCKIIYVCVPTPSKSTGECDTSILEKVIDLLVQHGHTDIPIASKSTAPPEVYEKLAQKLPMLVHVPEFLTQANAADDYVNAKFSVFGGEPMASRKVANMVLPTLNNKLAYATPIKTAALYKYFANSFLAMKVLFANEFAVYAKEIGVEWDSVRTIAGADARIGGSHLQVPGPDGRYGFGSACFSKDIPAAIMFTGKKLPLLTEAWNINCDYRNEYPDLLDIEQHLKVSFKKFS
jgi:UDPglucose 6-dehydrogenase